MEKSKAGKGNVHPGDTEYAEYIAEKGKAAVNEAVSGNPEAAKAQLHRGAEELQNRGKGYADQQKHLIADEVNHFGSALHQASKRLDEERDTNAGWVSDVADRVDRFANYVENSSTDKILHDSADYARNHPVLTAGALMAAGMAVSRFLKSGNEH